MKLFIDYLVLKCDSDAKGYWSPPTIWVTASEKDIYSLTTDIRGEYIGSRISVVRLHNAVITIREFYADDIHGHARVYSPPTTEHNWQCIDVSIETGIERCRYALVTWKHIP